MTIAIYRPQMYLITNITNSNPAVVTTSTPTDYTILPTNLVGQGTTITSGLIVRIIVPWTSSWLVGGVRMKGMVEINEMSGTIAVINPTQFSIDIDTTGFSAFAIPPLVTLPSGKIVQQQQAQVVPIGETNDLLVYAVQNILPRLV